VTEAEYVSREDRYDAQLKEKAGVSPERMSAAEKVSALRAFREGQYEKLIDAVYKRRGWTADGVPTVETLQRLAIDLPEVLEVVRDHQ
jgi:aldehyde:ferredoxin oxidoreductase